MPNQVLTNQFNACIMALPKGRRGNPMERKMKRKDILAYASLYRDYIRNDMEDTDGNDYETRSKLLARMYGVESLNSLDKKTYLRKVEPFTSMVRILADCNVSDDKIIEVLKVLNWGYIED